MAPSSFGSSSLSSSSVPRVLTWSSGHKMRTMSSKSSNPRQWPRCGGRRKTSLPWTMRNSAVVFGTTMASRSSRRFMENDTCTSSCATSLRSWDMTPWWSVKRAWRIQCVENLWRCLKLAIFFLCLLLKIVTFLDHLTSVRFTVTSFPVFLCW